MYRLVIVLALAYAVALAFHALAPRGEPMPINVLEGQQCCWLNSSVVDVVADLSATAAPLRWQEGFTAWRVGDEVEVRDPLGIVVMRTPGRYRISTTYPGYAVGRIERCSDCDLGTFP